MSEVPLYQQRHLLKGVISQQRRDCANKHTEGQETFHQVNWLIIGIKLPGRVRPEHPIDLRLRQAGVVD